MLENQGDIIHMKAPRQPKKRRAAIAPRTTLSGSKVELNLLPTFKTPPEPTTATSVKILSQICRSREPMSFATVVRNTCLPPQEAAAAIDYLASLGILVRIDEQDLYDLEPGTRTVKEQLTGGLSQEGVRALEEVITASLTMPLDRTSRQA